MGQDLLFEIGVEEIPPRESPMLARQLSAAAEDQFRAARLGYSGLEVYYTPRRLVLSIGNLDEGQKDITQEVKGPSKKIAFDADGKPTKAALGFCKGQAVEAESLYVKEIPEGEYVFAKKKVTGRLTSGLLPDILPKLIEGLAPSETMRWDDSGIRFIRPIRWLLCYLDDQPVEIEFGRLKSGKSTRGHRLLGEPQIEIKDAHDYFKKIKSNGVVLEPDKRRANIKEALRKVTGEIKAQPNLSPELLAEIADNLENPSPILGKFPDEFLKLPREILETTLIEHQKFIPFVVNENPSPYFVGFRDGTVGSDELVNSGYERVVGARLTDSQFFFNEDRRTTLSERAKMLKSVVYQERLGTISDKVERMRKFASEIGSRLNYGRAEEIDRTVSLCKGDLLTTMVGEFPELQGIVGGIYAKLEGEPELVSKGIYEHYLPDKADDPVPQTLAGIATSLADKLDTLVGSLLQGAEVTGSRDPFGLRRKANGIIRISLEHRLNLDFFQLIDDLKGLYSFLASKAETQKIKDFLIERLYQELRTDYEIAYDIVDAVTAARDGNFNRVLFRARALEKIREEADFQSLVIAFSRVCNITRGQPSAGSFDPQLFEDEAERGLWRAYLKAEGQIGQLAHAAQYEKIIQHLIELREPIDHYFDKVLVMANDRDVRQNRLGFLTKIVELFFTVGDLSKIVVEGNQADPSTTQKN
ncbi:glycine--tRNA ligase subunit beta [Candidatus Acetothermia bacterium]|nr:glycine--tRNA ligase subunit beta [Candidatus Acetothermia bacterium]MBI3644201.1 glycine--tRNA ligase subunit beta [Candidatus Acetothermia bacterium]